MTVHLFVLEHLDVAFHALLGAGALWGVRAALIRIRDNGPDDPQP